VEGEQSTGRKEPGNQHGDCQLKHQRWSPLYTNAAGVREEKSRKHSQRKAKIKSLHLFS